MITHTLLRFALAVAIAADEPVAAPTPPEGPAGAPAQEAAPKDAPATEAEAQAPTPADLTVEPAPRTGAESTLRVFREGGRAAAGATVRVRWRPGLVGAFDEDLGIADARGELAWTPTREGLAELSAGSDGPSRRVVVSRSSPPVPAITWIAAVSATAVALALVGASRRRP
jgi:hypothetical protein